jgi:hypothetical protein
MPPPPGGIPARPWFFFGTSATWSHGDGGERAVWGCIGKGLGGSTPPRFPGIAIERVPVPVTAPYFREAKWTLPIDLSGAESADEPNRDGDESSVNPYGGCTGA